MPIKRQLYVGFGALITLLLIMACTAYVGLTSTYNGFVDYRSLARETNLVGRIQANLLMTRIEVLKFLDSQTANSLSRYERRASMMNEFVAQAEQQVTSPVRLVQVNTIKSSASTYLSAFKKVVALSEKKRQLVDKNIYPMAQDLNKAFTAFLFLNASTSREVASDPFLSIFDDWSTLNRLVIKADNNNDVVAANESLVLIQRLIEQIKSLSVNTNIDTSQQSYSKLISGLSDYNDLVSLLADNIDQQDKYTNGTLHVIGPRIADAIEEFKLSVKQQQDTVGPQLQRKTHDLVSIVVGVAALSFALSFFVVAIIANNVRRPIGGEPKQICALMDEVACGDLTRDFDKKQKKTGIFRALVKMTDDLKKLLLAIVMTTNELKSDSHSGQELSKHNVRALQKQHVMIEELLVAVSQLSSSFKEVARSASNCSDYASQCSIDTSKNKDEISANMLAIQHSLNTTLDSISAIAVNNEQVASAFIEQSVTTEQLAKTLTEITAASDDTRLRVLKAKDVSAHVAQLASNLSNAASVFKLKQA